MQVNWTDKVSNMRALAAELNIGLDSFVFIDDNEFELDYIRQQLPQVTCLRVPEQPWLLPDVLGGARGVDRLRVSAEDRKKTAMYAQERRREQFKNETTDLQGYLRGLQIQLQFEPFNEALHLTRAAQLTQKTNQFNLTTRRFSEAELKTAVGKGARVFLASLQDRFGDYGRIAMAIVQPGPDGTVCDLDVFLMSCRVIGRGVEDSFLRLVMQRMAAAGFSRMRAEFIPTAKNVVCKDFLKAFGFTETERTDSGAIRYVYDMQAGIAPPSEWLTITAA
jgi:FkbH-like protein